MSISPEPGFPNLLRNNIEDRLKDYIKSLKFWVSRENIEHIYITEDTGFDLISLMLELEIDQNKITFIKLPRSSDVFLKGKGYGEHLQVIGFAHNISNYHKGFSILKCTGRDIVENYNKLFNYDCYFDICCDIGEYLTYSESRIFLTNYNFINNYLIVAGEKIDERKKIYFEHALARAVNLACSQGLIWRPLACSPRTISFSGTKNTKISKFSVKKEIKYYLKMKLASR
jgi:hypothetical protein